MKYREKRIFIMVSVTGLIIFGLVFGFIQLLNKPLFPFISDVSSSFESKYEDEDIKNYIKEEHGIDVEVLENAGAENLKTSIGGYAIVKAEDGTEFQVNINAFGAISGESYAYEQGKTIMQEFIKSHNDTPHVLRDVFTDISLETDDETNSYYARLGIDHDVDLLDDAFMEQLFEAYEIVMRWNDQLEKSDDLSFKQLEASYYGEEGYAEDVFYINLMESFASLEELEKEFVATNEEKLFYTYNKDLFEYVESFNEKFPEYIDIEGFMEGDFLECYKLEAIDHCSQLGLSIAVNGDEEFRYYDNEKMREKLLEAVNVIKSMDLPIEKVMVHRITLPFDLEYQDLDREQLKEKYVGGLKLQTGSFELEEFQQIEKTDEIKFIDRNSEAK